MDRVIGRKQETRELIELLNSNRAEFVAVYGRRRVGKTFLVDETLGLSLAQNIDQLFYTPNAKLRDEFDRLFASVFSNPEEFYLRWVKDHNSMNPDFWMLNQASQSVSSWRGVAFEEVCLSHIQQIKAGLGIAGVSSEQSAWALKGDDDKEGTQIDLLINRKDNVVNMCEMKFYGEEITTPRQLG